MFPSEDLRNASFCEVLGRVAYRLIVQDYHAHKLSYRHPPDGMGDLARWLEYKGFDALATWIRSYAAQWNEHRTVGMIRSGIINRARCGQSWRHVAYSEYKATRRADPRVTNRGVSSSLPPRDDQ